ncbi:16S rRNA (guanine(966)-N(2))-methyltransferase RsmD [Pseudomonas sp. Fl5BN2]|uniref:16S rRNA (guanine(966)-N(2))-methyltransferase RsmD n=1 Tax=unclassified Pseudomonas TaxID=196821 RepID=UPI0013769C58|nr:MULTISPECIES: 16S rRNA (guanine(966)-N(2))-methyltransferase RsmD [unclassified Pseudomonas]NBF05477.1 16S rRNA (guanine(966)-N(2))-methyltransferase RsmD [Pseudomonas sp. Fl5BN2]NBF07598.1 16S rRNA (guanine(966)-N(2))-methyltransferase RsmD [Pseudomonas sp. Fl4BN1]
MARPARPSKKPVHNQHNGVGQLRIIGGEWRSRKLSFPDLPGLRPTPDRVRETLFNWLAPHVAGAKVIDLFAGSGAVFLEALSRGAATGLALDSNNVAISSLREHLGTLHCTVGQAQTADALRYLETQPATPYDLAFLDPPFNQNLLPAACALLEERGWLAEDAWIYTESETPPSTLGLPGRWRLHREQKSGQVYYSLWQRMAESAA